MTQKEINETVEALRGGTGLPVLREIMMKGAMTIELLARDLRQCNNELCLYCGNYKQAHNGACNGCRWRIPREVPEKKRRETR